MRIISVSTAVFDGHGLDAAIANIAESGAGWIEPAYIGGYVDFDETDLEEPAAQALSRQVQAAGLRVRAVSAHMDLGDARSDTDAMLARRIRFAAALGARFLITNAGQAAARAAIYRRIETVLPICHASGVVLAVENPGHGTGALIGNAVDGARLVQHFDNPALRMNYDAGNACSYSGGLLQPDADVRRIDPAMIGHLHVKDFCDEGADWTFCAAGDGLVDYAALWPLLPADLPLSLELPLRLRRPGHGDPQRQAAPVPLAGIVRAIERSMAFVTDLDAAVREGQGASSSSPKGR